MEPQTPKRTRRLKEQLRNDVEEAEDYNAYVFRSCLVCTSTISFNLDLQEEGMQGRGPLSDPSKQHVSPELKQEVVHFLLKFPLEPANPSRPLEPVEIFHGAPAAFLVKGKNAKDEHAVHVFYVEPADESEDALKRAEQERDRWIALINKRSTRYKHVLDETMVLDPWTEEEDKDTSCQETTTRLQESARAWHEDGPGMDPDGPIESLDEIRIDQINVVANQRLPAPGQPKFDGSTVVYIKDAKDALPLHILNAEKHEGGSFVYTLACSQDTGGALFHTRKMEEELEVRPLRNEWGKLRGKIRTGALSKADLIKHQVAHQKRVEGRGVMHHLLMASIKKKVEEKPSIGS